MEKTKSNRKSKRRFGLKDFFMAVMAIILILAVILLFIPKNSPVAPAKKDSGTSQISSFRKDGTLYFIDGQQQTVKAQIDLEIAKTNFERNRGLMYRRSLPEKGGMLFIFKKMAPQSFWMKNTILSLDIIYIDDNFKIVSIAQHTRPYSLEPVRSEGSAIYVVEVNGGFCNQHGVKPGDFIDYKRF